MASMRELWIVLRARDEASRVVNTFSRNLRAAALLAEAATKTTEARAIRTAAEQHRLNSALAQEIVQHRNLAGQLTREANTYRNAASNLTYYRDSVLKTNDANQKNLQGVNQRIRDIKVLQRELADEAKNERMRAGETSRRFQEQIAQQRVQISSLTKASDSYRRYAQDLVHYRDTSLRATGATNAQIKAINLQITEAKRLQNQYANMAKDQRSQTQETQARMQAEMRVHQQNVANLQSQANWYQKASQDLAYYRDSILKSNDANKKQIDTVNAQIRALKMAQAQYEALAREEGNQASAKQRRLQAEVNAMKSQANALEQQANQLRQAANAAREHDIALQKLTQSMQRVAEISAVMAFALTAVGVAGLYGLKQAVDSAIAYERQVRSTATQVDGFGANLDELGDIGKRIANEIGVSFEGIQPALFDIFSSMEVNTKDAEKLLRSFSQAAVAGQVEIQDVSRATIGLLNAFNRPASEVNKILDMQFQLVQEGIGTYEEWNARIGLVTPSAVRAGQSIEIMVAALATATRMGMSAARSGTSVARAMDAMSHPAAVKNMEQLGVKVRDAQGKFLPMNETLRSFRDVLNKMPEKERLSAILDVFKGAGGTIEARRFLQNILLGKGNLELFDAVLDETTNSAGSMEKAYQTMADSVAVKSELLRNKWTLLKLAIGEALMPAFEQLIDMMSRALDWFNSLPEGTKSVISQFLLWGSIILTIVGALFGLASVMAIVIAAFMTIGTAGTVAIAIFTVIPVLLGVLIAAFVLAYQKSEAFRGAIDKIGENLKSVWNIFTETAKNIKAGFDAHLKPAFEELGNIIEQRVIPAFNDIMDAIETKVVPKIEEAGRIIEDYFIANLKAAADVITGFLIPAIELLKSWWDQNKATLIPFIEMIGQVIKFLLVLAGIIIGSVVFAITALAAVIGAIIYAFVWLWGVLQTGFGYLQQLWGWIQGLPAVFQNALVAIGQWFVSIGQWFAELPGRIMSFLSALPGMLFDFFTNALNQVMYIIGYAFGWITGQALLLPGRIMDAIQSLGTSIANFFTNLWNNAVRIIGSGIDRAVTFFANLPSRALMACISLYQGALNFFNRVGQGMIRITQQFIDRVVQFFADLPENAMDAAVGMVRVGMQIIQGAINGISRMAGALRDAAMNAVRGAIDGAMESLGISSPSKVFMEIGVNTVKGMMVGLQKMAMPLELMTKSIIGGVVPSPDAPLMPPTYAQPQDMTPQKTINNYITVNTNEIDPRLTSAELGWELAGRM